MSKPSLQVTNPKLSSEWHLSKNGRLTPGDVVAGSGKKVWWKCPKGEDHEWQAEIERRNRGAGCPYCLGRSAKSGQTDPLNPE